MPMGAGYAITISGWSYSTGCAFSTRIALTVPPLVAVIETLLGKGYELKLYDRNVSLAALTGANQDYILNRIPHISRLMVQSLDEVLDFAQTIVIGNNAPEFRQVPQRLSADQVVVDLARVSDVVSGGGYDGICW